MCGVLIIGSQFAKIPTPGFLTYGASKSFVSNLGRGLSFEFEGLGVDVLTYEPGLIESTIKEEADYHDAEF